MNVSQVNSLLRWLLGASGPVGALLVYWGVPVEYLGSLTEIVIGCVAVIPPLIALVLSIRAHSKSRIIAEVEAIPEVVKVLIDPAATGEVARAAIDPLRPKVSLRN